MTDCNVVNCFNNFCERNNIEKSVSHKQTFDKGYLEGYKKGLVDKQVVLKKKKSRVLDS